tara:strand:+ start:187 stop:399 length:213 start_codon:yes stop_codon:yes gene_type:complete
MIVKTNKDSLILQLTKRQLNIIASNLELQIYDLEDALGNIDKKAIKNDCVEILAELQNVGIWGQLPTIKK